MYGYGRSSKSNPFRHSGEPKPKREVFSTDEIPHLWAHQTQSRARNPQGNLFFDGKTIYSYRTSWPLARIYLKKGARSKRALQGANVLLNSTQQAMARDAGVLVLTNSERYSVTTAQHQSAVDRAVSHLPSIAVPSPAQGFAQTEKTWHASNLDHLLSAAASAMAKARRCNRKYYAESYTETARASVEEAARYAAFFGVRRKIPAFDEAAAVAAIARAESIESPDPVRDAKRFKAREKSAARRRAALQVSFDAYCAAVTAYNSAHDAAIAEAGIVDRDAYWREHGHYPDNPELDVSVPYVGYKLRRQWENAGFRIPTMRGRYGAAFRDEKILLRVNGDEIQTSWGARVPVAAAPMLWRLIERARAGEPFTRGLSRIMIGHYPLDSIGADGTLKAGCHTIAYDELRMLAEKLNLTTGEGKE